MYLCLNFKTINYEKHFRIIIIYGCGSNNYSINIKLNEMKKETLEEVADKESKLGEYDRSLESIRKNYFIKGAKWQQERSYSEEEVLKLLLNIRRINIYYEDVEKWFQQFKKK